MENEWELLDPVIKKTLTNVIESVNKLLIQNEKLETKMNELQKDIRTNSKISSEILEYLKENRDKYNKSFTNIEDKINDLDNKTDLTASYIKDKISDKISDKVSNKISNDINDPEYAYRINNLKWRQNRGIASLLNPFPPSGIYAPFFSKLLYKSDLNKDIMTKKI